MTSSAEGFCLVKVALSLSLLLSSLFSIPLSHRWHALVHIARVRSWKRKRLFAKQLASLDEIPMRTDWYFAWFSNTAIYNPEWKATSMEVAKWSKLNRSHGKRRATVGSRRLKSRRKERRKRRHERRTIDTRPRFDVSMVLESSNPLPYNFFSFFLSLSLFSFSLSPSPSLSLSLFHLLLTFLIIPFHFTSLHVVAALVTSSSSSCFFSRAVRTYLHIYVLLACSTYVFTYVYTYVPM